MPRYVYEGPRWYRTRIRSRGPFLAVLPPAVLGVLAVAFLNASDSQASGYAGLLLGVFGAPALLVVGVPFSSTSVIPIGIALSVLLWLIVGAIAARRTTRDPMATWSDFWRTYSWLACGIWVGALAALAVARFVVGDALV